MVLPRHPVKVQPHPNRTQTMTKAKFPATVEAVNGDWLTRTLRADGTLKGARISDFSVEPASGGYTSRVFRP